MKAIPVTLYYEKENQEPMRQTHIFKIQDWAVAYPEYLDFKIFKLSSHINMLSRGWHLVKYEWDMEHHIMEKEMP